MTDRVVYETRNKPLYVIQFEDENGRWLDSSAPKFRSRESAIAYLNEMTAGAYQYRIVERTAR